MANLQVERDRRFSYNERVSKLMSALKRLNFEEKCRREEFNRKYEAYALLEVHRQILRIQVPSFDESIQAVDEDLKSKTLEFAMNPL